MLSLKSATHGITRSTMPNKTFTQSVQISGSKIPDIETIASASPAIDPATSIIVDAEV